MSELMITDSGVFARAELDVQITTAKAYPRKQKEFLDNAIELATLDQDTAESCIYCLVRNGREGKTEIKGGSIRLAEIVASCWGNIHAATRIIENDGKFITAQGVAWDLEKNVKINKEVKRKITGRDGRTFSEDMQVVTGNAASSIALRNAIFAVVPKALVDRVYDAAVKFAIGDQKSLDDKRKSLFGKFNKLGFENKTILDFFGCNSLEEFKAEDMISLIGIGNQIRDGQLSIDKAFKNNLDENTVEDKIKSLIENK